jgi:hypothetical protein
MVIWRSVIIHHSTHFSKLSGAFAKDVLSFVESSKENPYTKEFAFIAAMIDLYV